MFEMIDTNDDEEIDVDEAIVYIQNTFSAGTAASMIEELEEMGDSWSIDRDDYLENMVSAAQARPELRDVAVDYIADMIDFWDVECQGAECQAIVDENSEHYDDLPNWGEGFLDRWY